MSAPVFHLVGCIGCGEDFKTTQPGKSKYCGKCIAAEKREKAERRRAKRQRKRDRA